MRGTNAILPGTGRGTARRAVEGFAKGAGCARKAAIALPLSPAANPSTASRSPSPCRGGIPLLLPLLLLSACAPAPPPVAPAHPQRVVSLDYCADQWLLKLLPRDRLLALSPDATRSFSYLRREAEGLPTVRPRAEDALVLRPDLVVRSYGGGPGAAAAFERAGVPVLQLPFAETLAEVRAASITVAQALGEPAKGRAIAAEWDRRLAALPPPGRRVSALYLTPGGVTSGRDTLVGRMMAAAGLANTAPAPGWSPLPLEPLAGRSPDLVVAGVFDGGTTGVDRWSAARHPVSKRLLESRPVVALPGAMTACGAWFVMDGVEAMARAREAVE